MDDLDLSNDVLQSKENYSTTMVESDQSSPNPEGEAEKKHLNMKDKEGGEKEEVNLEREQEKPKDERADTDSTTTTFQSIIATKRKQRDKEYREQVSAGTTEVQIQAADLRRRKLKRPLREPQWKFVGDTLVIWDIRAYAKSSKNREDALRKSKRRFASELSTNQSGVAKKMSSRRQRFHEVMEKLYQASLP